MMQSMKETLAYCTENFSPFQFHQLRIIEFPRYGTFAESFANTVPFSESIGFTHQGQQETRCRRPALLRDGARDRASVVGAPGDLGLRGGRDFDRRDHGAVHGADGDEASLRAGVDEALPALRTRPVSARARHRSATRRTRCTRSIRTRATFTTTRARW